MHEKALTRRRGKKNVTGRRGEGRKKNIYSVGKGRNFEREKKKEKQRKG